ncbi:MAG: hypothetical protein WCG35_06775 [Betaproteobacteria bacterium]
MDLTELKNRICSCFTGSGGELDILLKMVDDDRSIYPFNDYEHLICNLIENNGLTFEQYLEIRSEYISQNPNLWIFEISAPRGFGEKFAQTYIHGKCEALKSPSKKLDANYSGQYDMWLDGIKIEVKASRAVASGSDEPLYIKALSRSSPFPFLMNFQQLKPQCCDVFIWVAVFRDQIVLWVMNSSEVQINPLYSKGQHRGNSGNEGQLHVNHDNIHLLNKYELKDGDLGQLIRSAATRKLTT